MRFALAWSAWLLSQKEMAFEFYGELIVVVPRILPDTLY